jgi:hypothetical protein
LPDFSAEDENNRGIVNPENDYNEQYIGAVNPFERSKIGDIVAKRLLGQFPEHRRKKRADGCDLLAQFGIGNQVVQSEKHNENDRQRQHSKGDVLNAAQPEEFKKLDLVSGVLDDFQQW